MNLKGTFRCTQVAAKAMIDGGDGGSIINLSSVAAFVCSPNGVHYSASKAGVIGLTRATALDLAPHRIRVNAIAPGTVDTAQPRYGMSEEELAAVGPTLPLGRIATPDDIASLAVFLLSGESSQITGQTLHVNGGTVPLLIDPARRGGSRRRECNSAIAPDSRPPRRAGLRTLQNHFRARLTSFRASAPMPALCRSPRG